MQISSHISDIRQARAEILREWFALAPELRATDIQAAAFADRVLQTRAMPEDTDVKGWLVRYTGLKPIG